MTSNELSWRQDDEAPSYMGELVTVQVSDSIDDCLVLILHGASADPLDSTTVEVGRDEAREIIAGLAALL